MVRVAGSVYVNGSGSGAWRWLPWEKFAICVTFDLPISQGPFTLALRLSWRSLRSNACHVGFTRGLRAFWTRDTLAVKSMSEIVWLGVVVAMDIITTSHHPSNHQPAVAPPSSVAEPVTIVELEDNHLVVISDEGTIRLVTGHD
jgi:hypothetical protein